jgi:hypothetical protein
LTETNELPEVIEVGGYPASDWKPEIQNSKGSTAIVAANPFALIQHALDRNVDADQLEKLLSLQERWEANEARKAFMIAFSECQAKLPKVIKNKKNTHTNSMYPTLESVNSTCIPVITECGLSLSFSEIDMPIPIPNVGRMRAILRHRGGYSEEHHVDLPISEQGTGGKQVFTPTHAKGAWSTYAQRYLTCSIFSITIADMDTDGVAASQTLNEEQCSTLRKMAEDCEKLGASFSEARFMSWVSEEQKNRENVKVYEDIQQRFFNKAIKALDKKYKDAVAKIGGQ